MTVKFKYDSEYGLRVEAHDGDELTAEQAKIIAMREMAHAIKYSGEAFWHFAQAFEYKEFFDSETTAAIGQAAFALTGADGKKKTNRKNRAS